MTNHSNSSSENRAPHSPPPYPVGGGEWGAAFEPSYIMF